MNTIKTYVANFSELYAHTRMEMLHLNNALSLIAALIEWIYMLIYFLSGRWAALGLTFENYAPRYIIFPQVSMIIILALSNHIIFRSENERFKNFVVLFSNCLIVGLVIFTHFVFAVVLALCVIPIFMSAFFGDVRLVNRISLAMTGIYTVSLITALLFGDSVADSTFLYDVGIVYALLFGVHLICKKLVETEILKTRLYEMSKQDAMTDCLTGLPNVGAVYDKINEQKLHGDVYIALMDIDAFKHINDAYGHDFGNMVLLRLSGIMLKMISLEPELFAGRFGGDEFVMISRGMSFDVFKQRLEWLSAAFSSQKYREADELFTISIGMIKMRFLTNPEDIIKEVDRYLYLSKSSGKNRVTAEK